MRAPAKRERVKEILDLALERPTGEREAFVSGMSAGDEAVRAEVLSLLATLEAGGSMLEPAAPAPGAPAEPLTGLRFGAYRVGERIGAGGMGVVYKAEDARLGRTVAVKALPVHLTMDPHRRARFEQEARVLASVNHFNIGGIYGVEDTARGPVLVLEFVGGESLAQRIARGPIPLDDALPIARQILRALEAAHSTGVVHRDLKPANIHVLPGGAVKVLDFGIAKIEPGPLVASSPSTPGGSPVVVTTGPVGVLGTASYMSPEQARGKPVDRRTDIWAFGCLLYEMLAGLRAFEGETVSDTLAALLRAEPDWSRLPVETPRHVARLIRQCLAKDPERRLRDAGDTRLALESADVPADEDHAAALVRRAQRAGALGFAAGVLIVGAAAILLWARTRPPGARPPDRTVRFSVRLPSEGVPQFNACCLAVSPDGDNLVCAVGGEENRRLIKRSLGSPEWVDLPGTRGAQAPFFSPDGAWIGFASDGQLKRVPVGGGGAEVLVAEGVGSGGCSWSSDGVIVFADQTGGLSILEAIGSPPRALTRAEPGVWLAHPEFVPGQDAVLFTVVRSTSDTFDGRIEAVRIAGGARQKVYDAACCPFIVAGADGAEPAQHRLMFWQSGLLLAAPFDARALRVAGKAVPVARLAEHVETLPVRRYAVARGGGVLATIPGNVTFDAVRLAWFDPAGKASIITKASPAIDTPRLSPDGTRIVFVNGTAGSGDLWIFDLQRGTSIRLPGTGDSRHPLWTPDGRRIVFATTHLGGASSIRWIPWDQSSVAETIWTLSDPWTTAYPGSFTPDGRTLLMTAYRTDEGTANDLYAYDIQTREPQRPIFPVRAPRIWPRLSPDGALLAYTTEETGRPEVHLHRYPDLSGKTPVSIGGGYRPTWSADGRTLYYQWGNNILAVDIESTEPLRISRPRTVLEHAPSLRFDVARDGRILMPHPSGDWGVQDTIDVVVGWESLLGSPVSRP